MATKRDACPLSPVHDLMRKVVTDGDENARVSEKAAKTLRKVVQDQATAITVRALTLAQHAGRKKLTAEDVSLAQSVKKA